MHREPGAAVAQGRALESVHDAASSIGRGSRLDPSSVVFLSRGQENALKNKSHRLQDEPNLVRSSDERANFSS
jgi:hypothetical protein